MDRTFLCAGFTAFALGLASPHSHAADIREVGSARIAQVVAMLDDKPAGLGSDYHDRATWVALGKKAKFAHAIPAAEALLKKQFPPWNQAAYDDYAKTGSRTVTAKLFNQRTDWLSPLVTAECIENKGRFVPLINSIIESYCRQPTWQPPYNNPVPVKDRGQKFGVGLEAASFARDLAQALYLLDDKVNPSVRTDAVAALRERVFNPVLEAMETGQGLWWLRARMNWNSVCLAGVTGAALTILPGRQERAVFAAAGAHYSAYGLSGYSPDGYDPEGPGYYDYGFGAYITLREALWKATHGKLDLFADPKVRQVAMFGPRITITGGWVPPYEDCRFGTHIDPVIMRYCSRNLGLGLQPYDSMDQAAPSYDLVRECFTSLPNSATEAKPGVASPAEGLRSFFDKAQVLVCRPGPGGALGASMKGGNNDKPHNHNDVGSYVVVAGREEMAGDPGGPFRYNARTFGPQRYTAFKTFVSYGHPAPLIAGVQESLGADAAAENVTHDFTDNRDTFSMEMRKAYAVPGLQSMLRTFVFSRDGLGSMSVTDRFQMDHAGSFETAIISHDDWKRTAPDTITFTVNGQTLIAKITASGDWDLKTDDITEDAPTFHRLAVHLRQPAAEGWVTVTYTPGTPPPSPNP
ncbi:MAG TPA: hypothetical protein VHY22_16615 [Chthoniobacteraceae bacterium]|jgi:hypothetical protein|nr:hypothetical protein [Chthoniobacteraceae bacterium]